MYNTKIIELIKSNDRSNRDLAIELLISQHGWKREAAKQLVESCIPEMLGKTMIKIEHDQTGKENEELRFYWSDSEGIGFTHYQDCCEHVYIESIDGDLDDLIGQPLMIAEEVVTTLESEYDSGTATWYRFATIKGYVTVRWVGESNGYYSESVDKFMIGT